MNGIAATILIAVLAVVLVRQIGNRGPPMWVPFVSGAIAMVGTTAIAPSAAGSTLLANGPILLFLFGLFVFAASLEQSGTLDHIARWILGRAGRPDNVPLALFVGLGVLSAFLLNDALVLVGVPLLLSVARRMRVSATPLLLTLAFSVTVGSMLTPLGNPQNLLVSLESGMPAPIGVFLRYLLVPTAIDLAIGGLYVRWIFGKRLVDASLPVGARPPERVPLWPPAPWGPRLRRHPVLLLFPVTVATMIGNDVLVEAGHGPSIPLYLIAFGGALLVIATARRPTALLRRVDWAILALFAGLFVVVAGAVAGGVLGPLERLLPTPGPGHTAPAVAATMLLSAGGSQLVSNVPWVALQIPALHALGYGGSAAVIWVALAAGSTLAGNFTLLGAASNLIVVEGAERAGVRIGLAEFVRYGAPLAAMTLGVLLVCLLAGV
jgi:Na+/H+ antiporter NhaD/arsenite permease-like protein